MIQITVLKKTYYCCCCCCWFCCCYMALVISFVHVGSYLLREDGSRYEYI